MSSTRLNPTHVGWVGLGWVFLTHHDGLGQKIPSTRPNPTHAHPTRGPWSLCKELFIEALKFILTVVVKYVWFNGV